MKHDQKYFYKYVTAKTAKLILENLRVRCSSPLCFNDPFDTQVKVQMQPNNINEAKERLLDYLKSDESRIDLYNYAKIFFKRYSDDQIQQLIESLNERIHLLNRDDRIFCVSENKESLLMWAHYAENHSGAIIKLKCLPEINTGLCGAVKVKYSNEMPRLRIIDLLLGFIDNKHIQNIILNEILLTKSIEWEYEQEWRIILYPRDDKSLLADNEQYDDILISEQEIDSIYLGCKIEPQDYKDILKIIGNKRKNVKVFQASKDDSEFKLNFNELIVSNESSLK